MRRVLKSGRVCFVLAGLSLTVAGFCRQTAPTQQAPSAQKLNSELDAALFDAITKLSKPPVSRSDFIPTETKAEVTEVQRLLEAGASPNATPGPTNSFYNPKAKTQVIALILAVGWNHFQVVRLLVEHGADVNLRDEWGGTALLSCIDDKQIDMVRYLLEHGADVNAKGMDDMTPLLFASGNPKSRLLPLLLEHGANPNVKDLRSGTTPLMNAAGYGDTATIKLLLAHGADVSATNPNGMTALFIARARGNDEAERLLLAAHPKLTLREAARVNDVETVRARLDAGEKANTPDENGNLPIVGAVGLNCLETTRLLLDRGADVNTRRIRTTTVPDGKVHSIAGDTLLIIAAGYDYPEIVRLLLTRGANVNAAGNATASSDGNTALIAAVDGGHLEVVKILLRQKLDFAAHRQGGRALAQAIACLDIPERRILWKKTHQKTDDDSREAILALMLKLPLNYKRDGGFALCEAAQHGDTRLVKILLKRGANIDFLNTMARTPLMLSIEGEHAALVKFLLAKGANVHIKAKNGPTALELAHSWEQPKIAALLKKAGAKK